MRALRLGSLALLCGCPPIDDKIEIPETGLGDLALRFEMHLERYDPTSGEFTTLTPAPTARTLFEWVAYDGALYAFGGLDAEGAALDTVERYDPASDSWTALAPWPEAGLSGPFVLDDLICLVSAVDESTGESALCCYEPATDTWSARATLPEPLSTPLPVVLDGRAWLFGGSVFDGDDTGETPSAAVSDQTWSYDADADTWTAGETMPWRLGQYGLATLDGRAYLVGGVTDDGSGGTSTPSSMLVFDAASERWSTATQMPGSRVGFGVDALGDLVVAYFGTSSEDQALLDRYDPSTDAWTSAPNPDELPNSGVYTSLIAGDRLYLLTLLDEADGASASSSGVLWAYDASDDAWSIVGRRDAAEGDAFFVGEAIDEQLYFSGAETFYELGGSGRATSPGRLVRR